MYIHKTQNINSIECSKDTRYMTSAYTAHFINEGVKIWGTHSVHPIDVTDPYDELNVRLDLLECEKWSTKYVDQELKRIRDDEFLVRDIREELKLRIKLEGN